MDVINPNVQKPENSLARSVAQHCMVHVDCYYLFYAGGTSEASNIALQSAYYHIYKSGNFHKLNHMKVARANHVCFAEPNDGKHKKIYAVGGRNWVQQVFYKNLTKYFKER